MRKLHRAGAAVAVVSLVLTVSAFTRGGHRAGGRARPVSPGGPMITARRPFPDGQHLPPGAAGLSTR